MCLFFRYLYLTLYIFYEHEQIIEKFENMQEIKSIMLIIYTIVFKTIIIIKKSSETDARKKAKSKRGSTDPVLLASKFNSASSD